MTKKTTTRYFFCNGKFKLGTENWTRWWFRTYNKVLLRNHKKLKLINKNSKKLKILGSGEIKDKINIIADLASKSAVKKLEKIGGSIQLKK